LLIEDEAKQNKKAFIDETSILENLEMISLLAGKVLQIWQKKSPEK
jgi:hypothetical protein